MNKPRDVDVVIVGAGLAGLRTASLLVNAGASVAVLEAAPRVGGRTLNGQVGEGLFDLGGQWIGKTHRRVTALATDLGIDTFPTHTEGRKVMVTGGRKSTYGGTIPRISVVGLLSLHRAIGLVERDMRKVPEGAPHTALRASEWDGCTLETWKRRTIVTASARALFDAGVRVVFGAEPSEMSLLHFLEYARASNGFEGLLATEGGAQETRFVQGAQALSLRLAERLGTRVVLDTKVSAIAQDDHGVVVHGPSSSWRARRVVVAVPPALAGRIAYTPELPPERDQLTQRVFMGAATKCIATYDRPFWRDQGLSGEGVLTEGPVSATFDDTTHDGRVPALLGFVVGRAARDHGALPADERRRAVIASFAACFGSAAASPREYVEHDWTREPFTRGCPVGIMGPGTMTLGGNALRTPIGRVHFAGTETASECTGYMEGALVSAERVTTELRAS